MSKSFKKNRNDTWWSILYIETQNSQGKKKKTLSQKIKPRNSQIN